MTFLGPVGMELWWTIALGATLLAIGAYIVKMRRRRFEVPFVQLWQRVLDQNHANSLWKRFRRLLSLLLILAILGIMLFAALDPTQGTARREAQSLVILVDTSASMQAMDGEATGSQSRMNVAKQKAAQLVAAMNSADLAMVMSFDGQATPKTRFTSDRVEQTRAIEDLAASDTPADLRRALSTAADALRGRPHPQLVIVSDGAFSEIERGLQGDFLRGAPQGDFLRGDVDLSGIDVRYLPVGHRSDNVGIVAFNVRRYIANKAAYEAFIEIRNFGQTPARRQLTLYNGQTAVDTRPIDLAPGQQVRQIYPKIPGSEDTELRAVLRPVDKSGGDVFALDDTAYALLPARKKQKVLMVTTDNLFLEGALLVYDNVEPLKVTPAEYIAAPQVADGMDVVIFDDVTPEVVPPPPASLMYFHPTGNSSPIAIRTGEVANPHITEVDEAHPVMEWITMTDVYVDKSSVFAPDAKRGESTLAFSVTDSLIVAKRDGKRKILAFGFSLPAAGRTSATDLPMRVAFPLLLVNALDWFAGDQADLLTTYATGQRLRVALDNVVGVREAEIRGPQGPATTNVRTPVVDGLATFYGTRAGYYDLVTRAPNGQITASVRLAANLASPTESAIAAAPELYLGNKKLAAPTMGSPSRSQNLWVYLVVAALALLATEWITYHRRITV
jgi:hypothetical protein